MPWARQAACRDSGLEFVPGGSGLHDYVSTLIEPLEVCARCPVRTPCLRYALETGRQTVGIWGGTTSRERFRYLPRASERRLRPQEVETAVENLEGSFPARMERWRARAEARKVRPSV